MADISKRVLEKEIAKILKNANLANTSTKKVIQSLEKNLGVDLTEKKKVIDQLVMDYVNSKESDDEDADDDNEVDKDDDGEEEEEEEEEKPAKRAPPAAKRWHKSDEENCSNEDESDEEPPKKRGKKKKDDDEWGKKKEAKPKKAGGRGKGGGGYTREYKLSPELAELMGQEKMARHEVVKQVWAIIKKKDLYDPSNRQFAICDDALFKDNTSSANNQATTTQCPQNMGLISAEQLDVLLDFLDDHRDLARGDLSAEGTEVERSLWAEVTDMLNSIAGIDGIVTTAQQWQKVWADRRDHAEKRVIASKKSIVDTSGYCKPLAAWHQKVIDIMGEGFGDPAAVEPLPQTLDFKKEVESYIKSNQETQQTLLQASLPSQSLPQSSYKQSSSVSQSLPMRQSSKKSQRLPKRQSSLPKRQSSKKKPAPVESESQKQLKREAWRRCRQRREDLFRIEMFEVEETKLIFEQQKVNLLKKIRLQLEELTNLVKELLKLAQECVFVLEEFAREKT